MVAFSVMWRQVRRATKASLAGAWLNDRFGTERAALAGHRRVLGLASAHRFNMWPWLATSFPPLCPALSACIYIFASRSAPRVSAASAVLPAPPYLQSLPALGFVYSMIRDCSRIFVCPWGLWFSWLFCALFRNCPQVAPSWNPG